MSTSKVLLSILGAAAAGVVIGMLVAPEKGSDMRERLSKKADDLAKKAGELGKNLGNVFSKANGEMEEWKGKARRAKSAAEDNVNSIKESFS
jgi:gas vesicle protein